MGDGLQSCQHSMRLLGMCLNIHPRAKSQWQGSKAWQLTLTFSRTPSLPLPLSFSVYLTHACTHTHASPLQAIASIYTCYDQNTPRPIYSATASLVVSLILVSHRFTLQTTVDTGGVDGGEKVGGRLSTIGLNMLLVGRAYTMMCFGLDVH